AAFAGKRDADNYLAFCRKTEAIYNTLRDPFLRAAEPGFFSLIAQGNPLDLLATKPFATMWRELEKSFEDTRLVQLFGRYATYCGSSPFEAPATLMLIAHVEQEGVWVLNGGMQAAAKALEAVAKKNGAHFHYDTHVERILTKSGRACGVALADGEQVEAEHVLFNGDAAALCDGLLGDSASRAISLPANRTRSQAAMTWSMRAKTSGFELSAHNVFFSNDYAAEFDSVFKRAMIPETPTTYVFAPDRVDGKPAAGADERIFILVNAPPVGDRKTYRDEEINACQNRMLAHLGKCGLTLEPAAGTMTVTTPSDFAAMFPGTGGALFGAACHGWQASFQRPTARSKIPGLYLAGGSVHPGPGAPMAALSGQAAAAAIQADCGLSSTSRKTAMRGGMSTPSAKTAAAD
ncbi:MAG: phytoene desaturase family protein, partial [Hyphococcus sp.]